jgi:hypothetical protein
VRIHNNHQDKPLMKITMIIIGRGLAVKLRRDDWNELTGHPKDRGRNRWNSRTNSLQPTEDDVDQIASKFMKTNRSDISVKTPRRMVTRSQTQRTREHRPDGPSACSDP